jgi:hypothetical protein
MTEITQGVDPSDVSIAGVEPELHLPPPRSIPVEVVNMTQDIPPQAMSCVSFSVPQGNIRQILQADVLRAVAQISVYGTGQVYLCHSLGSANECASLGGTSNDVPGVPMVQGSTIPVTSVAPLWAVAIGAAMQVGVLQERRQ